MLDEKIKAEFDKKRDERDKMACCVWGGCNGVGFPGGRCDRCGTLIPNKQVSEK